jgi:energy-coupling factor transport system substrate-specific component
MSERTNVLRFGPWSGALLAVMSAAGLAMFAWPLFAPASSMQGQHALDAPIVFAVLLPLLVVLVLAQMADGGMDTKALAMLGVLTALGAALRPLGAGLAGIETVFFLLILSARVFGAAFGFVLGATSLFASALLTAGVGPWLPYQMIASAWLALGAGLLPDTLFGRPVRGRAEIALLAGYGVVAAYVFGVLMNLWFWPFMTADTMADPGSFAFVPGEPLGRNLVRFFMFCVVTSLPWDTGRAITDALAIILLGGLVLRVLRRASRKAHFSPATTFSPVDLEPVPLPGSRSRGPGSQSR